MSTAIQIIRRRRKRQERRSLAQQRSRFWTIIFGFVAGVLVIIPLGILLTGVFVTYARAMSLLPDDPTQTIYETSTIGPTQIYDSSGQTLLFAVQDPLGDQRRWITLDELPEYMVDATLLWEDPDFLENKQFNMVDVADQIWSNLLVGPLASDPSLTGRLVRNIVAPPPDVDTIDSQGQEIALIAEINRRYSAEEILEWHLNTNYYGNEAYGIEAAAQVYLGKSAADLTLDEAALLAAIPTAIAFNPVDNETAARGRQSDMLRRMLAAELITQSQFEQAINVQTAFRPNAGQAPLVAPEFAIYARRQAETILNTLGLNGAQLVSRGGLEITTTLDVDLYYQTECILRNHLARLEGDLTAQAPALDGSPCTGAALLPLTQVQNTSALPNEGTIVVLDARTGEVRTIVGDATRVTYQPGPTLYPFVYLEGMRFENYTAATMLLDIPREYPASVEGLLYIPQNPDSQFRGPLSLRDAMGASLVIPAVQVANVLNINDVLRNTARPMGINSLRDGIYDLSLMEQGGAVSALDMTYVYSVFASLGSMYGVQVEAQPGFRPRDPAAIRRIADADGTVIWEYDAGRISQNRMVVLQDSVAYLINDVLADQSTRRAVLGEGNPLAIARRAAVVTGLTRNQMDNWTIGYTPQFTVGVHLGRTDGGVMSLTGFGVEGAAPVWRAVMDYVHTRDGILSSDWSRPESIAQTEVCRISGLAPNGICETRPEIFLDRGQFPPPDTYWIQVDENSQTRQRATINTPAGLRTTQRYFIPPDEAQDWWRANNRPLPPVDYDNSSSPEILSSTAILQPSNLEVVNGVVDIRGSMNKENMRFFQLAYGESLDPSTWRNITDEQSEFIEGTSLGLWDTSTLADGTYVLRLTVARENGLFETGTSRVIVDNTPPAIVLYTGEAGQVYRWPQDVAISLVAEVTDNFGIDRVEFYQNGQFITADDEAPFRYDHLINRAGTEIFTAVVFDTVGNSSQIDAQVEVIRSN